MRPANPLMWRILATLTMYDLPVGSTKRDTQTEERIGARIIICAILSVYFSVNNVPIKIESGRRPGP